MPGSSRHDQVAAEPGVFMRASAPRESTSWACTMASRQGAAWASRIIAHAGSGSAIPAARQARWASRRRGAGRVAHQPTTVSLSCVPV